jgi:hypothetical protein
MIEGGKPLAEFLQIDKDSLKSREVYFNASGKFTDFLKEILSNVTSDHFLDIIEFDLCDSTSVEPKTNDEKARASASLQPAPPAHGFFDIDRSANRFPWVTELVSAIVEYRDSDPEFEKKMARFLYTKLRVADSLLTEQVAERLADKLPIHNRYITKRELSTHKEAMNLIYGEKYLERAMEDLDALESLPKEESSKEEIATAAELMSSLDSEVADRHIVEEISLD